MSDETRLRQPGGTSGGLGSFLLGFVMAIAGGYLFLDRVTIFGTLLTLILLVGGLALIVRSLREVGAFEPAGPA